MKKETNILFEGEPFMATIDTYGNKTLRCVPFVYNEGVGICLPDGTKHSWGLLSPKNPIAAWRATEVLRCLREIGPETLCEVYHAGLRSPERNDLQRFVLPMIQRIGLDAYERIMALPVPEPILRAILHSQTDLFGPELSLITDEVRAGAILWHEEFSAAGVLHPDDVDRIAAEEKALLEEFEELIQSYACYVGLRSDSVEMKNIKCSLLAIVARVEGKFYPPHVLIAAAGVTGKLLTVDCDLGIARFFTGLSESKAKRCLAYQKELALVNAARWIASNPHRSDDVLSFPSAKRLLEGEMAEYVSLKQANVAA